MEYIKLNLGKYLTNYLFFFTRYTLICIALCSEFVNEKSLRNFLLTLQSVYLFVQFCPGICSRESLEELKVCSCRNSV